MILYSEEKTGYRSVFVKTITNGNGNPVSSRKVSIPLFQQKKDGYLYFVLYDDHMRLISDAYEYLNFYMRECPPLL